MITVMLDRFQGLAYHDDSCEDVLLCALQDDLDGVQCLNGNQIITSTENMILALRVLIKEGKIPLERIKLIYATYDPNRETIIELDTNGRIVGHIPAGFGDWSLRMMLRLA